MLKWILGPIVNNNQLFEAVHDNIKNILSSILKLRYVLIS